MNRKKSSCNLKDTDHAKERYQEVVDLVRFGKSKLRLLNSQDYYEGYIDPQNGADWNQTAPISTEPDLEDLQLTVSNYLSWEVSCLLKNKTMKNECIEEIQWKTFVLKELFGESSRGKRLKSADRIPGDLPFVTAGEANEGVSDFIGNKVHVFSANTITIDMFGSAKYRNYAYGADDHIKVVHTENIDKYAAMFVTAAIHKSSHNGQFDYGRNFYPKDADALTISLPVSPDGEPDYDMMGVITSEIHKITIQDVVDSLQQF